MNNPLRFLTIPAVVALGFCAIGQTALSPNALPAFHTVASNVQSVDKTIATDRNWARNNNGSGLFFFGGPPANDNCAGAITLTVGAGCTPTIGDVAGATQSLAAITCATFLGDADDDVWYKFVATATTATIQVVGSANFDAVVDLRSGACNGVNISCADATVDGGTETINATALTIGNTYYVRVYDYLTGAPPTTTFDICVFNVAAPPANDNCAAATLLTVNSSCVTTNGTTAGATETIAALVCATFTGNADDDVWYRFVATATTATIEVEGSATFDAVVDLRSGACNGVNMACADATLYGGIEVINATGLTVGATYRVRVYHYDAGTPADPTFTICVYNTPAAPVNDLCSGAVVQNLNVPGSVTVNGNNIGATDTEGIGTATVWEAFTIGQCANVTADFCGSVDFTNFFISITDACPFVAVIDSSSTGTCGDGTLSITWNNLPAGTYYYPVLSAPGLAWGPYTVEFSSTTCGSVPANDNCSSVTPQALAVPGTIAFNGDNTGATLANDGVLATAAVWHAFTITACADIEVSYCGTSPAFNNVYIVLAEQCPVATTILSAVYNTTDCVDGNWTVYFDDVPAGTYYLPVLSEPLSVGPYDVTVTTAPCVAVAPVNDLCASIVPQNLNIGGSIVFNGDNTNATTTNDYVPGSTWEIPPPVLPSVWHAFTVSACADITVEHCGTNPAFGNVWIILATSCPGNDNIVGPGTYDNTSCGDGNYSVFYDDVPAGTYYLPVLGDVGAFGPYTVTVSATACAGVGTCDGGLVLTSTFTTSENVCQDAVADLISFINTSTSTESYDYILTDASDNIISLLAGASFDFETAALGTYHVWGVSYNGVLTNVIPGAPVSGVGSNGTCFDLSTNFVSVNVDICQGLNGAAGSAWSVYPNPSNGDFTVRNGGASGLMTMEVLDLGGRLVHSATVQLAAGQSHQLELAGELAQGSYTLRISNGEQRYEHRLMVK